MFWCLAKIKIDTMQKMSDFAAIYRLARLLQFFKHEYMDPECINVIGVFYKKITGILSYRFSDFILHLSF